MKYFTPQEIAEQWGISSRRVQYYCSTDRIAGAKRVGRQWMIPENALRPEDGRSPVVRTAGVRLPYRFPALVHTRYFAAREELSEPEQRLLDAQILHLKGNYSESVDICCRLLETSNSAVLCFGCHYTLAFNSVLMGLRDRLDRCVADMQKLLEETEEAEREDLAFLLAVVQYHCDVDPQRILSVNPGKLSADALEYYQHILLVVDAFCGIRKNRPVLPFYEVLCRSLEVKGMTPTLLATHAVLSSVYIREENMEMGRTHMEKACAIGVENDWINYLAKFFGGCAALMEEIMEAYGGSYRKHMLERNEMNLRSWKYIYSAENGSHYLGDMGGREAELLLLLSFGLSYDAIAKVRRTSRFQVEKDVRHYCEELGLRSKNELVDYCREVFRKEEE